MPAYNVTNACQSVQIGVQNYWPQHAPLINIGVDINVRLHPDPRNKPLNLTNSTLFILSVLEFWASIQKYL
jgi:hypothetical protein